MHHPTLAIPGSMDPPRICDCSRLCPMREIPFRISYECVLCVLRMYFPLLSICTECPLHSRSSIYLILAMNHGVAASRFPRRGIVHPPMGFLKTCSWIPLYSRHSPTESHVFSRYMRRCLMNSSSSCSMMKGKQPNPVPQIAEASVTFRNDSPPPSGPMHHIITPGKISAPAARDCVARRILSPSSGPRKVVARNLRIRQNRFRNGGCTRGLRGRLRINSRRSFFAIAQICHRQSTRSSLRKKRRAFFRHRRGAPLVKVHEEGAIALGGTFEEGGSKFHTVERPRRLLVWLTK